ncbi:MAG: flagellar M-ring protein FliF [Alphaproteobacteria bacterium]|nr:flagellar M-ring protein FliF [Alphaproteobacteria bacterium]
MSSFADTIRQLGAPRLAIMAAIMAGMVLFFIFVSLRVSTPPMKMLYSELSSADSGAIAAKLEESQIPYEASIDGSQIMVPEDEVGRARLLLAEAGLPNGGSMGYELFDEQSSFGTTNFVQNINQVRALEGELARTISSLDSVRSARVHLVLPQRELFSRESRSSSASVYLGVRPGAQVERENIYAIQSLVASAVPDLKASNVTIIDSNGNLLARGGQDGEANQMTVKAEEMRRSYEGQLTSKIEDQVSRVVGFGNVRAIVTAEMNFDRISTNEELYDPEGQVLRSSQVTSESSTERDTTGQDVSVANNLPGVGGDLLGGDQPSAENNRSEEVTNFEISKTIRSVVREVGEINKLSIAVLVDGRYNTDEEGNKTYQERSPEEIAQIEELVKSAVGYDEERGDVITVKNMQFAEVDTDEEFIDDNLILGFPKSDLIDAAELILIFIMVILVILLVLQPMVKKLLENTSMERMDPDLEMDLLAARQETPALSSPEMYEEEPEEESLINIGGVEGKVKSSSIKKVEEIVENYPNETVSVIRSWMTQDG